MLWFTQRVEIVTTIEVKSVQVQNTANKPQPILAKNAGRQNNPVNRNTAVPRTRVCPYKDIIYKYFGEDKGRIAVAVAMAETGCNATSVNWNDAKITGMPSNGIFQLNRPYHEKYFDPEYNISEAYKLFIRRGFQPWSVWLNGSYKKYL